jgi:hypothetical protein
MTNNELIEHPMRTNSIITAARSMNISDSDLLSYAIDAIDELDHHAYDALDDPRISIILIINALTGSDDDHDDMIHDLTHALNMIDECTDHPQNCASCCDLDD